MAEKNEKMPVVLEYAYRVVTGVLTLLIAVIAWQGQQVLEKVSEHETRIVRIEANNYTGTDAAQDNRLIVEGMSQLESTIRTEMQKQHEWIQNNHPAPWLVRDVAEIKSDLKDLQTKLQNRSQ